MLKIKFFIYLSLQRVKRRFLSVPAVIAVCPAGEIELFTAVPLLSLGQNASPFGTLKKCQEKVSCFLVPLMVPVTVKSTTPF